MGNTNLNGCYETFNNGWESGLTLTVYGENTSLVIWACQARNSDQIMIICGDEDSRNLFNMFNEEKFKSAKYFKCDDYDSAVEYVYKQVKYIFRDLVSLEKYYSFDINYSLDVIQRIKEDEKMLDYEDYHELASFYDKIEKYSCDLIICNGKMGIRYNSHNGDSLENLTFIPYDINLDSEYSIMLDMKNNLNQFINDELEYSITMDDDIKI